MEFAKSHFSIVTKSHQRLPVSLANNNPIKYRAYIDGLRAIAVLAVLFYHAGIGFRGGYVGVDVFFVISGYLITGLILKDLDPGRFHVLNFWERRVRRIMPALAVVVLACLATGWFLFLPLDFKELGQSAFAQALLGSNVFFWQGAGYFAQAGELKPLLHTWSLAVEEQFYLLFPFLLIALKRCSRASLVPAILLLCGVSFSLSVYWSYVHPLANFYLLPTRAWELLLGALLAAIPAQRACTPWLTESLGCGGLLAILYAVFFYGRDTQFPGVAALLPCVGTASVIWANGTTLTCVGKLLAVRPAVFIGLISYALYLWHWPMLVFARYWTIGQIPLSLRLLLLVASVVLAVLSWRFVEIPIRKRVLLKNRVQIFSFAITTTALILLVGLAIDKMQGIPSRVPAAALQYATGRSDRDFLNALSLKEALNGNFIELGAGDKHLPINVLVWGDSHAMAAMPVLDFLCREHSVRGVAATHSSTAPLVGYESRAKFALKEDSIAFNNAVLEFIRSKRVGDVVLVASWSGYYITDGDTARLHRGLLDTISALRDSGARIWIMKEVPRQRSNVPLALASAVFHGRDPEELGVPVVEHNAAFRLQDQLFAGMSAPGVAVIDPTGLFLSPRNLCRVAKDGKALYCDEQHLTVAGAMMLRPLFESIFEGIGGTRARLGKGEDVTY